MSKGRTIAVSNTDIEVIYKALNYYNTEVCNALESVEEELETTRDRYLLSSNPVENKVFAVVVKELESSQAELTVTKSEVTELLEFFSQLEDDKKED
jgi:hypothetical protein